jgi:hypothetical protein
MSAAKEIADLKERLGAYSRARIPQWEQIAVTEFNRLVGGYSSMSYSLDARML